MAELTQLLIELVRREHGIIVLPSRCARRTYLLAVYSSSSSEPPPIPAAAEPGARLTDVFVCCDRGYPLIPNEKRLFSFFFVEMTVSQTNLREGRDGERDKKDRTTRYDFRFSLSVNLSPNATTTSLTQNCSQPARNTTLHEPERQGKGVYSRARKLSRGRRYYTLP